MVVHVDNYAEEYKIIIAYECLNYRVDNILHVYIDVVSVYEMFTEWVNPELLYIEFVYVLEYLVNYIEQSKDSNQLKILCLHSMIFLVNIKIWDNYNIYNKDHEDRYHLHYVFCLFLSHH